jgi:hypothetical protein
MEHNTSSIPIMQIELPYFHERTLRRDFFCRYD